MFKIEGTDIYSGSRKVGELRGSVLDAHGQTIGSFKGRQIFDKNGGIVGTVRGEGVYDHSGTRVTTIGDIKKLIQCRSEVYIAALWLLLSYE